MSTLTKLTTTTSTTTTTLAAIVPTTTTTTTTTTTAAAIQTTTTAAAAQSTTTSLARTTTTATATSSAATTTASASNDSGASVNVGLIAGIAGGVVGAIVIIGLISWCTKTRRRAANPDAFDQMYGQGPVSAPRVQAQKLGRSATNTPTTEAAYAAASTELQQQQQVQQQGYVTAGAAPVVGAAAIGAASIAQYQQQQQQQQQQYTYPPQQYYQQQADYSQYYQQQQGQQQVPVDANGQPDYSAQWQQYFAENPGAYEAYVAQQQQLQQQYYQQPQPQIPLQSSSNGNSNGAIVTNMTETEEYVAVSNGRTQSIRVGTLNAADFETYEEFVEAQQAQAASITPAIAAYETPVVVVGASTMAYQRAEQGGNEGLTQEELEHEEKMKRKLAKEAEYIKDQQQQSQQQQEEDVPGYSAGDEVPRYSTK